MTTRRQCLLATGLAGALALSVMSAPFAAAVDDSTAPVGAWTWPTYDRTGPPPDVLAGRLQRWAQTDR